MSKQRPPVVEASEVMGNGESVPQQQVAQRFAKFLAIGAARLLAKGTALIGIDEQEESPVGQSSSGRSMSPTIRESVGDAAEAPKAEPEVAVVCGEGMADQAGVSEPANGTGADCVTDSGERGDDQLCIPYE